MRLDAAEDGVEEGSVVVVTAPSPSSSSVVLLKYSCLWDYKQSGRRSLSWHAGDTSHGAGRKTLPFLKTVR